MLGSFYLPEYFDWIEDPAVKNALMKISEEINQDLSFFQDTLQAHGVRVIRPALMPKEQFVETWQRTARLPMPPLQVRNFHSVVGHQIYQLTRAPEVGYINAALPSQPIDLCQSNREVYLEGCRQNIDAFDPVSNTWYCRQKYHELAGPDWPLFRDYVAGDRSNIAEIRRELHGFRDALCYETKEFGRLMAPNLFPLDGKLYIDCKEYFDYRSWAARHIDFDGEIVVLNSKAGHCDGCYVVLGKKVIIGIVPGIDYDQVFPGYQVVAASDSYQSSLEKRKQAGSFLNNWWIAGQESNTKLIDWIGTYMQDFVGTAYETVFDLNVLAIDQEHVCMIVSDKDVVHNLNRFGINVIEIPWRHRFFVDCGLHCITLDLARESQ